MDRAATAGGWMRLVCSGWRTCSGGLGSVVLDRGGGESARAKGGGWESVVDDGEVVVGWPTVCAGSGKPGKKRRRSTRRCVHTKQTWTIAECPGVRRTPRCVFCSPSGPYLLVLFATRSRFASNGDNRWLPGERPRVQVRSKACHNVVILYI